MKGLDWSNERYVRLHTRNTTSWALLGYETQCLWLQLLRMMDRSGVIPLDPDALPHEGIAALLPGSNDRQIEKQLESLIDRGWLIRNDAENCLVDPAFIDREEAAMSNALRLRESRARRRDRAVTQNESKEPGKATRTKSQPTQLDTGRHAATQSDTPSVPSGPSVTEAAGAAGDNGKPKKSRARVQDLSYPAKLLRLVPDFQERWLSSRKIRRLGQRTTIEAEQKQIDHLAKLGSEHGGQQVIDQLELATESGWQGIHVKKPRGRTKPGAAHWKMEAGA